MAVRTYRILWQFIEDLQRPSLACAGFFFRCLKIYGPSSLESDRYSTREEYLHSPSDAD